MTQKGAVITEFSPDELVHLSLKELTQFIIENDGNGFKEPEKVVEPLNRSA